MLAFQAAASAIPLTSRFTARPPDCSGQQVGELPGGENVKRVEAIISPFKLDDVKSALSELGVTGLTATEVRGCGRQKGYRATDRDTKYRPELTPKVKVEAVVADHLVA